MKKRILLLICCFVLAACSNSQKIEPKNSATLQNSKNEINDEKYEIETTTESITLHNEDKQFTYTKDFGCDKKLILKYETIWDDIFPELKEYGEYKQLYSKGRYLINLFGTENIYNPQTKETAYISLGDLNQDGIDEQYYETPYKFDSFYSLYVEVFTEDIIQKLFDKYPFYYSYNEKLWIIPTLLSGDVSVIHEEYKIIENSPNVFRFECKKYHIGEGEERVFDPNDLTKYTVSSDYYSFINTEVGWRISECPLSIW